MLEPTPAGPRRSLLWTILAGSSTIAVAAILERGASFAANLLAARITGREGFGAYMLLVATAGTVATYCGAGIGAVATRFGGEYPPGHPGSPRMARLLFLQCFASAGLAVLVLFAGSGWLAHRAFRETDLETPLRVASIAAGGLIVVTCAQGLLVGHRRYRTQVCLSMATAAMLLVLVPIAARLGVIWMIGAFAAATALPAAAALVLASVGTGSGRDLATGSPSIGPMLRYGLALLGGNVGLALAAWWLLVIVARRGLDEAGLYAVASQFMNLTVVGPTILAHVAFPMLTEGSAREFGGPDRVLRVNTAMTAILGLAAGGVLLTALPWLLALYGTEYRAAEPAAAAMIVAAVLQAVRGPAAGRLSIVSLRALTSINLVFAIVLAVSGAFAGRAIGIEGAALAWAVGQALALLGSLVALHRSGALPAGVASRGFLVGLAAAFLGGMSLLRSADAAHSLGWTVAMVAVLALALFAFRRRAREQ